MSVGLPAVAGAAAAPATGGLSALLLPLLLNFGPALFSKLFGGNSQQHLRDQIAMLLSPANLAKLQGQYYQQNLASPAFSQAQGAIASGANQTANLVAQHLGASGIGSTGTGAVLSSLTPSLVGSQQAALLTAANEAARSSAQTNIAGNLSALTGTQGPSQTQQLFGAGLEGFGPYLQAYLKTKFPSLSFTPQAAK